MLICFKAALCNFLKHFFKCILMWKGAAEASCHPDSMKGTGSSAVILSVFD